MRRMVKNGDGLRFLQSAVDDQPDECRVYPYSRIPDGYGHVWFEGRARQAGEVVLILDGRPKPGPKYHAAHAPGVCHNRACISPSHLRWATAQENNLDKLLDGTADEAMAARRLTGACFRGHLGHWRRQNHRPDSWQCAECVRINARKRWAVVASAARSLGLTSKQFVATYGYSMSVARFYAGQEGDPR